MCGRAKLPDDVSELKLDLKIDWSEIETYRPSWNAAPTSRLPVVLLRGGERVLTLMRWGLVPSFADDIKIGRSTFNARAETLATRPAFRSAWKTGRRCLVVADAYYEWRRSDKQPFAVALRDRKPMTFAGLWDVWRAPDGEALRSFTIITTPANHAVRPLHDRMPALLTRECRAAWLGETPVTFAELRAMLRPYAGDDLVFWPVARRVGDVRNDEPDLFASHQTGA